MVGSWSQNKRDMYAGGHPNDEARAVHKRFVAGPLPRIMPIAASLRVRGRISGDPIDVPLATIRYQGEWYLVSMLGAAANWVRNVEAADGVAILTHGRRRPVRLVDVPVEQRAPIIKRYLFFAVGARPHVELSWKAPITEFRAVADRYPVFRITPGDASA